MLAAKGAVGVSAGDGQRYGSYRLGGDFGESGLNTIPDEWRALRGYFPASVSGNSFYLGSVEYRMPLVWLDRGFNTYPLFLRYMSAAVFVDVGNAFDEFYNIGRRPLLGMGAELKTSIVISWGQGLTLRTGYGFSPLGDGIPLGALEGFYFWLGSSF